MFAYVEDIALKLEVHISTFWLCLCYIRVCLSKGTLDPSNISSLITGTLVCLSLAIKYNEAGLNYANKNTINRKDMGKKLDDIIYLTIISEQKSITLDEKSKKIQA